VGRNDPTPTCAELARQRSVFENKPWRGLFLELNFKKGFIQKIVLMTTMRSSC